MHRGEVDNHSAQLAAQVRPRLDMPEGRGGDRPARQPDGEAKDSRHRGCPAFGDHALAARAVGVGWVVHPFPRRLKRPQVFRWHLAVPDRLARRQVGPPHRVPFVERGQVRGFQSVIRDITERRRFEREQREAEARLLETQRLESLGVLAGGVAHDFNNILTAMMLNLELLQAERLLGQGERALGQRVGQGARLTGRSPERRVAGCQVLRQAGRYFPNPKPRYHSI